MEIDLFAEKPKLRKILKTDAYQNFELAEKHVISHNTATYIALLTCF